MNRDKRKLVARDEDRLVPPYDDGPDDGGVIVWVVVVVVLLLGILIGWML